MKSEPTLLLRKYMNLLRPGTVFAAKPLRAFGGDSIYKALSRQVKTGALKRVSRGVYFLPYPNDPDYTPSAHEIASTKAKDQRIQILSFSSLSTEERGQTTPLESRLTLPFEPPAPTTRSAPQPETDRTTVNHNKADPVIARYYTNGSTSSFATLHGRVARRRVSNRRIALGDSQAGQSLRRLWDLGPQNCESERVRQMYLSFNRTDKEEVRNLLHLLPGWLMDKVVIDWRFVPVSAVSSL